MSKIGKRLVNIPAEVDVKINDGVLEFSSKDGKKSTKITILSGVSAKIENNALSFSATANDLQSKANWGTIRAHAKNAIEGIKDGFKKVLELNGVGFRASVEGKTLVLNIGFSHQVKFNIPEGITAVVDNKANSITITGIDKALVGEVAAKIRSLKKPNPYRGTGIKYSDEILRKKAGKKASGATGAA